MGKHCIILMGVLMATYLPGAISKELPESEAKFVGMYVQRDVDSQAQLFLLDDYTFCFTFMGGSLDLIKAGRWKSEKNESAIHIQEERADCLMLTLLFLPYPVPILCQKN